VRRIIPERFCPSRVDVAGVGLCIVASLVFYGTTVEPFLQRQRALAGQREELRVRQDKAAESKAAVAKARERLAVAQEGRAAGTIGLEPAAHVNKRLAALTQLFSGRSVEVDDVQTGEVSGGPHYNLVPITITGRGSYASFVRLFGELRSVFPDMSVARIELAGQPGQTGAPVTFQFDLLWYTASDRSAAGPAVADGRQ